MFVETFPLNRTNFVWQGNYFKIFRRFENSINVFLNETKHFFLCQNNDYFLISENIHEVFKYNIFMSFLNWQFPFKKQKNTN